MSNIALKQDLVISRLMMSQVTKNTSGKPIGSYILTSCL